MAEAAPGPSAGPGRFFCHQCSRHVSIRLPEFTCFDCESGFVEQVPEEPCHLPVQEQGEATRRPRRFDDDDSDSYGSDPDRDRDESVGATSSPSVRAYPASRLYAPQSASQRQPATGQRRLHPGIIAGFPRSHFELITDLLSRFTQGGTFPQGGSFQILHSDPGDYAWGVNGLDAIITQLLNNMDASGPPAADQNTIASLPSVKVTEEQADAKVQCSVCFDEFAAGDDAICLPCKHLYHKDCIVKWLKMHGTCPVCRKDLNGADTSTQEYSELTETLSTLEATAGSSGGTSSSTAAPNSMPGSSGRADPSFRYPSSSGTSPPDGNGAPSSDGRPSR